MRISDWSSDVCSSDLPAEALAMPAIPVRPARQSPMLKDSELDTQRGGQSLVITNQTMDSIVAGNVLNGDYTAGSVALSDFALSNFNGVGNLLIKIGRAHVCTPVTNAHLVCRLLLQKKNMSHKQTGNAS